MTLTITRRPVGTSLIALGIFLFGVLAYGQLPIGVLPTVDAPSIKVTAALSGASPQTMAATVAAPLERQLGRISGVTNIRSYSIYGRTAVEVEFEFGRNIDRAASDVQAAINAAAVELPGDLSEPPSLLKDDGSVVALLQLALTSKTLPPETVFDWGETVVAQKLAAVEGVAAIDISAADEPAVRVRIDPATLSSLGLGWEDVSSAIAAATAIVPKGSIDGSVRAAIVADTGRPHDAAGYRTLVIADRQGAPVHLGDIARVNDDTLRPHAGDWLNGHRAVFLSVKRQAGANILETTERIRTALRQIGKWLPAGIKITVLSDRSNATHAIITDARIRWLAAAGFAAASLALLLSGGWAAALPSLVIPIAIAGSLIVLALLHFSLDLVSLTALTLAVGFIAHDAFMMADSIAHERNSRRSALGAAIAGAGKVGRTIFAMSVVFGGALLPLLFAPGASGRISEEFAVALGAAVAFSAGLALTVIPAVSACLPPSGRVLRGPPLPPSRLYHWYGRSLRWLLRHRTSAFVTMLLAYGVTAAIYLYIPAGFVPAQDSGIIWGWTEGQIGASPIERSRTLREVARIIMADPAVAHVGYGISDWDDWLSINLRPEEQRAASAEQVIARLEPKLARLPSVKTYLQPVQDFWLGGEQGYSQYQYLLLDEDVDELYHWLPVVRDKLRQLPELKNVAVHQQPESIEARLTIDRDRAAQFGASAQDIGDALYDAFGQRQAATIYGSIDQVPVILEANDADPGDSASLKTFPIKSTPGAAVSLGSIARTDLAIAPMAITRQGQLPYATLGFDLTDGTSLGRAVARIRAAEAELRMPQTIWGRFDSNAEEFVLSRRSRPVLVLEAVLVVYIVLGILFESYTQPLTVLATVPLSALGAGLALLASGFDVSLLAFIGIVLLVGICAKSAVIIVETALREERERGLTPVDAVLKACLLRLRSILGITAMTVLSALPLAFATGPGSELQRPLGIAVTGGVIVAQLATLYATPVVYLQFALSRLRARRLKPAAARR